MAKKKDVEILGVGLDGDGDTRITRGDNMFLYGGTQETHQMMQETAVKLNEHMARRGKTVGEASRQEIVEACQEIRDKMG